MLYCKVFLIPYSPSIAYMTTQLKNITEKFIFFIISVLTTFVDGV